MLSVASTRRRAKSSAIIAALGAICGLAAILVAGAWPATVWPQPSREPGQAQLDAERELIGKVLNYRYNDAADLRVVIRADGIFWQGTSGPLQDMRGGGSGLRLSKIAEGIYFGTWANEAGGEDSIVWNFNDMRVFAHVLDDRRNTVFQLEGVIKCYGDENQCAAPDTRPMSHEERTAIWRRNNAHMSAAQSR